MTDLEEPVGNRVPVAQELVVAGNAEVERASDAEQRAGIAAFASGLRIRVGEIERELALQIHDAQRLPARDDVTEAEPGAEHGVEAGLFRVE